MRTLSGTLPWTKSCFVCGEENPHGLRLRSRVEDGKVIVDYTTRETDVGYRGIVHGGIMMTLLDEVMTWAAILAMRKMCVAAELNVRLRRPVGVGQALRAEGRVTRPSARLTLTEGVVLDSEGNALLTAEGKYMPMSEEQAALSEKDFVLSPGAIRPGEIVHD
ncbi:MAG: PaaI family thioesterase [Kiritimatiellae bacterium]|nr:PaaI family thioesterase [Kiritimatiellia bacterium]